MAGPETVRSPGVDSEVIDLVIGLPQIGQAETSATTPQDYAHLLGQGVASIERARDVLARVAVGLQGVPVVDEAGRRRGRADGVYVDFDYLAPVNLQMLGKADAAYLSVLKGEGTLGGFDTRGLRHGDLPREWKGKLAGAVAGLSANEDYMEHRMLLSHRDFQEYTVAHFMRNQDTFAAYCVLDLSDKLLKTYGMNGQDIKEYQALLPQEQKLPELSAPPLHLTQLAADTLNPVMRRRTIMPRKDAIVTAAVEHYVTRRYEYGQTPGPKLASVLIECDLAERQSREDLPDAARGKIAARLQHVTAKTDRRQLPQAALTVIDSLRS